MALGQIKALVIVNSCVKFHCSSFKNKEVIAKVKVFHAYTNHDNDDNNDNANSYIPLLELGFWGYKNKHQLQTMIIYNTT